MRSVLWLLLLLALLRLSEGRPSRERSDNEEDDGGYMFGPRSISNIVNSVLSRIHATDRHVSSALAPGFGHSFSKFTRFRGSRPQQLPHPPLPPLPMPPRPRVMHSKRPQHLSPLVLHLLEKLLKREHRYTQRPFNQVVHQPQPIIITAPTAYPGQPCASQSGQSQVPDSNQPISGRSNIDLPVPTAAPVVDAQPRAVLAPNPLVMPQQPDQVAPQPSQQPMQLPSTPTLDMAANMILQGIPQAQNNINNNALTSSLMNLAAPVVQQPTIDLSGLFDVFREQQRRMTELHSLQQAQQEQARSLAQSEIERRLEDILKSQTQTQVNAQTQAQWLTLLQAQMEARSLAQALTQAQSMVTPQQVQSRSTSSVVFNNPAQLGDSLPTGRSGLPDGGAVDTQAGQNPIVQLNPTTIIDLGKLHGNKQPAGGCHTVTCWKKYFSGFGGGPGPGWGFH